MAVAATVISGVDYFFGFRKRLVGESCFAIKSRPQQPPCISRSALRAPLLKVSGLVAAGRFEPLPHGGVVAGVRAALELAGDLGEQAVALGHHVVAVDRLEVLLAGVDEGAVAELGEATR